MAAHPLIVLSMEALQVMERNLFIVSVAAIEAGQWPAELRAATDDLLLALEKFRQVANADGPKAILAVRADKAADALDAYRRRHYSANGPTSDKWAAIAELASDIRLFEARVQAAGEAE